MMELAHDEPCAFLALVRLKSFSERTHVHPEQLLTSRIERIERIVGSWTRLTHLARTLTLLYTRLRGLRGGA